MKGIISRLALIFSLLLPVKAFTLPMLSDDGSLLTGVLVNGQLYDVTFGDAVLGDIYPASVVSQPGWFDLANAVKQGIVDALNALPALPALGDINGCDYDPPYSGITFCLILIPDQVSSAVPPRFRDTNAAALSLSHAYRDPISNTIDVLASYDTGDFGPLTFAQFRPAVSAVPTPGSLALTLMALTVMGYRLRPARILRG